MVHSPKATATVAGHPIHAFLVGFPIAAFLGALLTDIAYWKTSDLQWSNFSVWLITAGLVFGGFAALAGIIDFTARRDVRAQKPAWPHALGNVLALVIALVNAFVHSRDGYTAVVPTGLILSLLTVLILAVTGWLGATLFFRDRVGVQD